MPMKVKFNEATQAQLLAYCTITLGIPAGQCPVNTGIDKLRAKVMQMQPGVHDEEITIPDGGVLMERAPNSGGAAMPSPNGTPTAAHGLYDPKVEVTVFKNEANKGEPIEVSVNGRNMLIPVGIKVPIPYRYFLVLQNCIGTVFTFNPKTNENEPRDELRHPHTVHSMPSQQQIADWDAALTAGQSATKAA